MHESDKFKDDQFKDDQFNTRLKKVTKDRYKIIKISTILKLTIRNFKNIK